MGDENTSAKLRICVAYLEVMRVAGKHLTALALPRQVWAISVFPQKNTEMNQKLMNQKRVHPPQQKKQRWWAKRGIKIGGGLLVVAVLLVLSYIALLAIDIGPVTAYRMLTSGNSNIYTYTIFPKRAIATGGSVSTLQQASLASFPTTITYSYHGSQYTTRLNDLLVWADTQAFIVIRNNAVIYEQNLNGAHRDTLSRSFSMAKSFTSALIGIAIDVGTA